MVYLQCWHGQCHVKLLPSRRVLSTAFNHAPCHFMQNHIRKMQACLAVTCHLHFWQNDLGLLRSAAVTRGWNGYQNKSQHRKLTLEKIKFSLQPFDHGSGTLTLSPSLLLPPIATQLVCAKCFTLNGHCNTANLCEILHS